MLKVAAYERWGTGALAEFWDNPDNFPDSGFPAVRELFEELRARRNAAVRFSLDNARACAARSASVTS